MNDIDSDRILYFLDFQHYVDEPDITTDPNEMEPEQLAVAYLYDRRYFRYVHQSDGFRRKNDEFKAVFWKQLLYKTSAKRSAYRQKRGIWLSLYDDIRWGLVVFIEALKGKR